MAVLRPMVIIASALLLTAAAAANVGPAFTDAGGDAANAPDIRTVDVGSDGAAVSFAIHTANAAAWQGAAAILALDTDANQSTGDAGGERGYELSYVLHSNHDALTLDESSQRHVVQPAATWRLDGGTLTITAPRSELRAGPTIGFRVETLAPGGSDDAPDGSSPWQFSPDAVPATIAASFLPVGPRHGRAFALARVMVSFSDGNHGPAPAT